MGRCIEADWPCLVSEIQPQTVQLPLALFRDTFGQRHLISSWQCSQAVLFLSYPWRAHWSNSPDIHLDMIFYRSHGSIFFFESRGIFLPDFSCRAELYSLFWMEGLCILTLSEASLARLSRGRPGLHRLPAV